jgi:hypothetical protein
MGRGVVGKLDANDEEAERKKNASRGGPFDGNGEDRRG